MQIFYELTCRKTTLVNHHQGKKMSRTHSFCIFKNIYKMKLELPTNATTTWPPITYGLLLMLTPAPLLTPALCPTRTRILSCQPFS